jgi:BlaI family transcriptional regulator, penicillinase repressor
MNAQRHKPLLTRVESEVMQALWQLQRGTVHEVQGALSRPLAYTTVLSVLRTLEEKGHVQHQKDAAGGRAYLYRPIGQAQAVRRRHLSDLVQRFFGGQPKSLVTGLIEDEQLSRGELEDLRTMIDAQLAGSGQTKGKS